MVRIVNFMEQRTFKGGRGGGWPKPNKKLVKPVGIWLKSRIFYLTND